MIDLRALKYNQELYRIVFEENVYFDFKLLNIKDFKFFNNIIKGGAIPPFIVYEEIFNICYLGKVEFLPERLPVGYIVSTGNLIFLLSGGDTGEKFLVELALTRKEMPADSLYEFMRSTIFSAFNSLTPSDIDLLTEKQFMRYFVSAENKLEKTLPGYQRLDLKKIYDELYGKEETETEEEKVEQKQEVVFNALAAERELGSWEVKEAEARFLEEEKAKMEALKRLDGRRG